MGRVRPGIDGKNLPAPLLHRRSKGKSSLKNSIDTLFMLPQYLVVDGMPVLRVGLPFQEPGPRFQPNFCKRENRSRRNLHGNEEESKKEETLTASETTLAYAKKFTGLLREAPLKRLFRLEYQHSVPSIQP